MFLVSVFCYSARNGFCCACADRWSDTHPDARNAACNVGQPGDIMILFCMEYTADQYYYVRAAERSWIAVQNIPAVMNNNMGGGDDDDDDNHHAQGYRLHSQPVLDPVQVTLQVANLPGGGGAVAVLNATQTHTLLVRCSATPGRCNSTCSGDVHNLLIQDVPAYIL